MISVTHVGGLKFHTRRHHFTFVVFILEILIDVFVLIVIFVGSAIPDFVLVVFLHAAILLESVTALDTLALWGALFVVSKAGTVFFKAMGFFATAPCSTMTFIMRFKCIKYF